MATKQKVLRVANCSGFYGDRIEAAREMVEGGPIDVLTGDYLAELTLMILHKDRQTDPSLGYAKTFLVQLRQIAATCLQRGIKIVVNAGGLNPAGCAEACRVIYRELGLTARVAHLDGDDLLPRLAQLQDAGEEFRHLDRGMPLAELDSTVLSANAYLGAWGIAKALDLGADLVICPRVTDASLVVGPAAWKFGWARDDWNRLASAVVAGHILECGPQATGGNYSFWGQVQGLEHPGFPLAEIAADGSFTITKHPGTGGRVSVGTVTAQLLYEIDSPSYRNPDVTARFDTIRLRQEGKDRVRVDGVQGEPPPTTTKVCMNYAGGYKNSVTFLLTGLDIEAKAALAERTLWQRLGGREQFADSEVVLHHSAPATRLSDACSFLTIAVKDADARRVGRRFSAAAVEMALASYPGLGFTAPPTRQRPFGVYWPTTVASDAVEQRVWFEDRVYEIDPTPGTQSSSEKETAPLSGAEKSMLSSPSVQAPLGKICGTRSGDKGGNANLGIWVRGDDEYAWLQEFLSVNRLRQLIPEAQELELSRYLFPNLRAINFVLHGLLGDGVAASLATDAQAKGLGEFLRAQAVSMPRDFVSAIDEETR